MATRVKRLVSVDPATGETVEEFDHMSDDEVERVLDASRRAFPEWRDTPVDERAARLRDAAAVLRRERERLAAIITREMGKPITEARAEVEKCAFCCEHYAANAARFLADEPAPSDSPRSFVAARIRAAPGQDIRDRASRIRVDRGRNT